MRPLAHAPTAFLVDDDTDSLVYHRMALELAGWSVHAFGSARDCLDVLRVTVPDCVVTDLEMPDMDGAEFEFTLKAMDIAVPVVVVTDATGSKLAQQVRALGVRHVLRKPALGLADAVMTAATSEMFCPPRPSFPAIPAHADDFREHAEARPGMHLFLSPDLTILAASADYRNATLTRNVDIVGQRLFDVFPDNPDDPACDGVAKLRVSLERVLESVAPDGMALQRYDIRDPAAGNAFVERWWSPVNCPVLTAAGAVRYIVHSVADVTRAVQLRRLQPQSAPAS